MEKQVFLLRTITGFAELQIGFKKAERGTSDWHFVSTRASGPHR
jgi:hypothetical protein